MKNASFQRERIKQTSCAPPSLIDTTVYALSPNNEFSASNLSGSSSLTYNERGTIPPLGA